MEEEKMNRPKAESIARMICYYRKDFPLNAVAKKLTEIVGYSELQIIAAACLTAHDHEAKTIQAIERNLARVADNIWETPQTQFAPNPAPQAPSPAEPKKHLHPVTRAESCPIHEGGLKNNCSGCRADALALPPTESENHDD